MIENNRVTVNGLVAVMGMQVDENDVVCVDGVQVFLSNKKTYLKFYKPTGVVCTFEEREKNNLRNYLKLTGRITYAGRLDRNSEGLLLLTDDGDLIDHMMTARNLHEKEYEVTVNKPVTEDFVRKMSEGIFLKDLNVMTRPCHVKKTGEKSFTIILTQGLNRQIRRMCRSLGFGVAKLKRVRVVNILLDGMNPGEVRELSPNELDELKRIVG